MKISSLIDFLRAFPQDAIVYLDGKSQLKLETHHIVLRRDIQNKSYTVEIKVLQDEYSNSIPQ